MKKLTAVDLNLIEYLYGTYEKRGAEIYLREVVTADSVSRISIGRMYLIVELVKKYDLAEVFELLLDKLKTFIARKICTYSKKIKGIFMVLKKTELDIKKFIDNIEFRFSDHSQLAYRLAAI